MSRTLRFTFALSFAFVAALHVGAARSVCAGGQQNGNALLNPSFELGRDGWYLSSALGTVAAFTVDDAAAADGQHSALVTVDAVAEWGVQFGQMADARPKGRTYTLAALARSADGPVSVGLMIERRAEPWDKAASSPSVTLTKDAWTELHVTFRVEADFPEGWFVCVICTQPHVRFRVDAFRLYEGNYVPCQGLTMGEAVSLAARLLDTGRPLQGRLTAQALSAMDGWAQVPPGEAGHSFKGDAVLLNSRIAVALRRNAEGAELYAMGALGPTLRAVLRPIGSGPAAQLSSIKPAVSDASARAVLASFQEADGRRVTVRCELGTGQVFVTTEAGEGVRALRVDAPCRFAVLPDFFADDIVADASDLPASEAELLGENFLLHMLDDGGALLMAVWSGGTDDVRLRLSEREGLKAIAASDIPYGKERKVWVALLEGAGVWHVRDVTAEDAGRVLRLDWAAPYAAQWRVDWRRDNGLTDSWEMVAQRPNGEYVKQGWFGWPDTLPPDRKRWTTVLGWFAYPCWLDKSGQAYLQPLTEGVRFQGPALIYPINRVTGTPLSQYTVVDVVRSTLGVGPCEYILDVEGQTQEYRGMATCGVRDTLDPIYAAGEQKQRRAEIERALTELMAFIRHIRGRIEAYVDFGHEVRRYLAEQRQAQPKLTHSLAELEEFAAAIDEAVERRRQAIKTPDYAAQLVEQFRAAVLDYDGPDALERCRKFTEAWVEIGGNQDELVGECRWAVKVLRQRAGLAVAADPRLSEVGRAIRQRSQQVLRNPAGHEGARH